MAYTPINWQTGDTITAEKLNKMDNGWRVDSTQLLSETVTTVDDGGVNYGSLAYASVIDAATITVTFDGTAYQCTLIDGVYGAQWSDTLQGYDFSTYPFNIGSWSDPSGAVGNDLYTETAGSHTVAVSTQSVDVSANFSRAVAAAGTSPMFEIKSGVTTWQEAYDAVAAGKVAYFVMHATEYGVTTVNFCIASRVGISSHGDYKVSAAYVSSGNTVAAASLSASAADGVLSASAADGVPK